MEPLAFPSSDANSFPDPLSLNKQDQNLLEINNVPYSQDFENFVNGLTKIVERTTVGTMSMSMILGSVLSIPVNFAVSLLASIQDKVLYAALDIGPTSTITDNMKPFNHMARLNLAVLFAIGGNYGELYDQDSEYELSYPDSVDPRRLETDFVNHNDEEVNGQSQPKEDPQA